MLVLNKILAIYVGPAGYAMVGQLQNIIASITAIASAGVSTGVTKYTAEYQGNLEKQASVWQSAFTLALFFSTALSIICLLMQDRLSFFVFSDYRYSYIFAIVSVGLFFYSLNTLILSLLNGLKEINIFVSANIANSLIALCLTGVFSVLWQKEGALIALALNQSIVFLVTLIFVRKRNWLKIKNFIKISEKKHTKKLLNYSMMAIATSVIGPMTLVIVRKFVISDIGLAEAGYWEAMNKISSVYLLFISTPLTVYFVPKLSEIFLKSEIQKEMRNGFKLLIPVGVSLASLVFIFRELIINILFTKDFMVMEILFKWQMLGDIFKVIAWVFSYFLLAKAQVFYFLVSEIFTNISLIGLSYYFLHVFGFEGISIAYMTSSIIYLMLLWFFSSCYIKKT